MCTLRAFFVISEGGDIVISRKYITVEKRAKALYGDEYEGIGSDWDFEKLFIQEVSKIDYEGPNKSPVISIRNIWPIVYINKFGTYIVAIPLIDGYIQRNQKSPSSMKEFSELEYTDSPYISSTLSFLESLVSFIEPCTPRFEQNKITELQSLLSIMIQFGKPIITDYISVKSLAHSDLSKDDTGMIKRPLWKPVLYHGKNHSLGISLIEYISSVQYDKEYIKDTNEIHGNILCRCDIEGSPDISIIASRENPNDSMPFFYDVKLHPCSDRYSVKKNEINISCSPPIGPFKLCKYIIDQNIRIPIRGFYQMKEITDNQVQILIQLKLQDNVNNHFEFCNVEIPFPNRNNISALELNPTIGNVSIHPKLKNMVIWNIGTKFSSKNLEVSLPGTIYFNPINSEKPSSISYQQNSTSNQYNDPFLIGQNAYIKINFKIMDWSLTGLQINQKMITIQPKQTGFKNIHIEHYVRSNQYIIWNSLGESRYCDQT